MGDLDSISIEDGQARVALRCDGVGAERRPLSDLETLVEAIARLFEDARIGIRSPRIRRDRLYARAYLLRRLAGLPPRHLAIMLGISNRYARFAVQRGRSLVQAAASDGRLDDALVRLARGE
jgi:hypothetical protein